MWIAPEKNYTIDQLDDLFATLTLQLQPKEHFFFILQRADFLTAACANKLLKSMEEPPRGYHFILLAERIDQLLPTIRSRCIIHILTTQQKTAYISHPLMHHFAQKMVSSDEFAKIIDSTTINERESIELLDHILVHWLTVYKNSISTDTDHSSLTTLITKLHQAQLQPPMPGSNTTFWRNLYLQTKNSLRMLQTS
jgi:hypothetical protein